jgi:hypothetical protein
VSLLHHDARDEAFDFTSHFREETYSCLTRRGDTLYEICDAMLCENGPVTSPVDLTLLAEHRRGHGAMYDALNQGRIDVARRRKALAWPCCRSPRPRTGAWPWPSMSPPGCGLTRRPAQTVCSVTSPDAPRTRRDAPDAPRGAS